MIQPVFQCRKYLFQNKKAKDINQNNFEQKNEKKEIINNNLENDIQKDVFEKEKQFFFENPTEWTNLLGLFWFALSRYVDYLVIKSNTPLINVSGCTGHPGIYKSIGYFSKNSRFRFVDSWKTPPEIAQAPARITILGLGVDL